jgi:hypothetical protein
MAVWSRRYRLVIIACALFLGSALPMSAEERLLEERDIAGWLLIATTDDSNRRASCTVTRTDELGPILGVSVQSGVDAVFLVLGNLTPGEMELNAYYDVSYRIDDGTPVDTAAQARSPTMFLIAFGKNFAALEPLRRGRKIDFLAPDTIALFDLAGSSKALDALQDCTERHVGLQFSVR